MSAGQWPCANRSSATSAEVGLSVADASTRIARFQPSPPRVEHRQQIAPRAHAVALAQGEQGHVGGKVGGFRIQLPPARERAFSQRVLVHDQRDLGGAPGERRIARFGSGLEGFRRRLLVLAILQGEFALQSGGQHVAGGRGAGFAAAAACAGMASAGESSPQTVKILIQDNFIVSHTA